MDSRQIYHLPVGDTISTAWHKVSGAKASIWAAIGIYLLVSILLSVIELGAKHYSAPLYSLISLVNSVISFLLQMGILYIGILRAMELPISYRLISRTFNPEVGIKLILMILLKALLFIPFALVLLIGILFSALPNIDTSQIHHAQDAVQHLQGISWITVIIWLLTCFAAIYFYTRILLGAAFILDKNVGPIKAITMSYHATRSNFWRMIGVMFTTWLITLISACLLLIGLIWTIPLNAIIYGMMYKRLLANAK